MVRAPAALDTVVVVEPPELTVAKLAE